MASGVYKGKTLLELFDSVPNRNVYHRALRGQKPPLWHRLVDWAGVHFPNRIANALPPFLAPQKALPFDLVEYGDTPRDYAVSDELQQKMDKHITDWNGSGIYSNPHFPDKIFKGGNPTLGTKIRRTETFWGPLRWEGSRDSIQRAPMAKRMREAIDRWDLDRLYVPEKKIGKVKGRPIVVAERLDLSYEPAAYFTSLNTYQKETLLTQFFTLVIQTGCSDLKFGDNVDFIRSGPHRGCLAIYDTEPFGIDRLHHQKLVPSGWYHHGSRMYDEEVLTPSVIYMIGGERNAEIAMGMAIAETFLGELFRLTEEDRAIALRALQKVCRQANCEYSCNFLKAWAIRLLLPAAAAASIALSALFRKDRDLPK